MKRFLALIFTVLSLCASDRIVSGWGKATFDPSYTIADERKRQLELKKDLPFAGVQGVASPSLAQKELTPYPTINLTFKDVIFQVRQESYRANTTLIKISIGEVQKPLILRSSTFGNPMQSVVFLSYVMEKKEPILTIDTSGFKPLKINALLSMGQVVFLSSTHPHQTLVSGEVKLSPEEINRQ